MTRLLPVFAFVLLAVLAGRAWAYEQAVHAGALTERDGGSPVRAETSAPVTDRTVGMRLNRTLSRSVSASTSVAPRSQGDPEAATLLVEPRAEDGGASGEGNEPGRGATTLVGREPSAAPRLDTSAVAPGPNLASRPTSTLSRAASIAAIRRVFGVRARPFRVATCESKLNARAVSRTDDWGLFQLHRSVWDPARNPRARPYWPRGKDWRHVLDPVVNARVAWAISKRGTDFWTHWRWSAGCWA